MNTVPNRTSPAALVEAFAAHFNAGRHEALLSLYAPEAVFLPAPGQPVRSSEGIRGALATFLALGLPIDLRVRHVIEAGDMALVLADWALQGTGPSGEPMALAGTATDVLRRDAAGVWYYLIDNPFGVQAST